MKIDSIKVINMIKDGKVRSIYYDFLYNKYGFSTSQRIDEGYVDGDLKYTNFYPNYEHLGDENEILIEKLPNLKENNNIFYFYKKIEKDIFSFNLDFKLDNSNGFITNDTLFLTTDVEDYVIKLEFDKKRSNISYRIIIKKVKKTSSDVSYELYFDPVIDVYNIDKILNGKNRIKYLLDNKVLNFIKEYNTVVNNLLLNKF